MFKVDELYRGSWGISKELFCNFMPSESDFEASRLIWTPMQHNLNFLTMILA